jgi:pilus assembly protein Flp/PilA
MSGQAIAFRRSNRMAVQLTMGFSMRKLIASYLIDDSGAAAAEYALILTIIGTALLAAVTTLGADIGTALTKAGTEIAGYTY